MPNGKAPGKDGFPVEFFKEYWDIIGGEVVEAITQFFQNGKLLRAINTTTITLIPKVPNPTYVKDFKSIASCTYKIIAKILSSKLKLMVDYLVGPSQSALIGGRIIMDNVILADELVKGYDKKNVSPRCTIKVDISKGYDSVE